MHRTEKLLAAVSTALGTAALSFLLLFIFGRGDRVLPLPAACACASLAELFRVIRKLRLQEQAQAHIFYIFNSQGELSPWSSY